MVPMVFGRGPEVLAEVDLHAVDGALQGEICIEDGEIGGKGGGRGGSEESFLGLVGKFAEEAEPFRGGLGVSLGEIILRDCGQERHLAGAKPGDLETEGLVFAQSGPASSGAMQIR